MITKSIISFHLKKISNIFKQTLHTSLIWGCLSYLLIFSTQTYAQDAIINEWSQGISAKRAEYIEILVLKDGADLTGWKAKDFNQGTLFFEFSNALNNVPAGTIIVVYSDPVNCGGCNLSDDYHLPSDDVSMNDCNYKLQFPSDNRVFLKNSDWGVTERNISNTKTKDNPQLFNSKDVLVHDWDFNDNKALVDLRPGSKQAVYFTGSSLAELGNATFWKNVSFDSPELTPGTGNFSGTSDANLKWVNGLRTKSCIRFKNASTFAPEGSTTQVVLEIINPRTVDLTAEIAISPDPNNPAEYITDFSVPQSVNNNVITIDLPANTEIINIPVSTVADCIPELNEKFTLIISKVPQNFTIVDHKMHEFNIENADVKRFSAVANPSSICSDNSSQLEVRFADGSLIPPLSELSFTWEPKDLVLNDANNSTQTQNLTQTQTFTCTVTDISGCSEVVTIEITVKETPKVNLSADKTTICAGEKVILTAEGADSYTWDPISCNDAKLEITPDQTSTYTVEGTKDGCVGSASITILVKESPKITLSESEITLCKAGEKKIITVSGADSYEWLPLEGINDLGNGQLEIDPGKISLPGTNYLIKGKTGDCSAEASLKVNIIDKVNITATASISSICEGDSKPIILTSTGGDTYIWAPATGLNTTTEASVNATGLKSSVTYTVTAIKNGCTGSATVTITVNKGITITINPPSDKICEGESVVLAASGADSYLWAPGNSTSNPLTVKPTQTTTYTVTGSKDGCTGTAVTTITIVPKTPFTVNGVKNVCKGEVINLELISSNKLSYKWLAVGLFPEDYSSKRVIKIEQTTTFTIQATNTDGCISEQIVTINASDSPNITLSTENRKIVEGKSTTIKAESDASKIQWEPRESLNTHEGNEVIATPLKTTTYTVTAINASCAKTDTITIFVDPYLYHLPNAFTPNGDNINDQFTYQLDNPTVLSMEIKIFNRWGEEVFYSNELSKFWNGKKGGSDVSEGVYFYNLKVTRKDGRTISQSGSVTIVR